MQMLLTASGVFQSTPPCGGDASFHLFLYSHYISIHAPLRGRLVVLLQDGLLFPISIHAPLRGRHRKKFYISLCRTISIHAPLRGRPWMHSFHCCLQLFQSTPPCGGDPEPIINADQLKNFNPRPLAGATGRDGTQLDGARISIHAPLRGRPRKPWLTLLHHQFQSTPPCGGDSIRQKKD